MPAAGRGDRLAGFSSLRRCPAHESHSSSDAGRRQVAEILRTAARKARQSAQFGAREAVASNCLATAGAICFSRFRDHRRAAIDARPRAKIQTMIDDHRPNHGDHYPGPPPDDHGPGHFDDRGGPPRDDFGPHGHRFGMRGGHGFHGPGNDHGGPGCGDRTSPKRDADENADEWTRWRHTIDDIQPVLTSVQQAKWSELFGEPFADHLHRRSLDGSAQR